MKTSRLIAGIAMAAGLAVAVTGCKVESSSGTTGAAGDTDTNTVRVAPMDRDDVKRATGLIIDGTAEAVTTAKDAAVTASQDIRVATDAIRERREAERAGSAPAAPVQQSPTPVSP